MAEIICLEGQNLLDLAIQECGSVEAAFYLAVENVLSITDELVAGQAISIVEAIDKPIAMYYSNNDIKPATGFSSFDTPGETEEEGISIWAINIDFIVQ